jgi:hypothetical protein
LSGGEVLLNKGIEDFLEAVLVIPNYQHFFIITNGTYIPKDSVLKILSANANRLQMQISCYKEIGSPKQELLDILEKWDIPYTYRNQVSVWYDLTNVEYHESGEEELKQKYLNCGLRKNHMLKYIDGYLSATCCRVNRMFFLDKWNECEGEWIKISDTPAYKLAYEMKRIQKLEVSSICRYCDGLSNNTRQVVPALDQLKGRA